MSHQHYYIEEIGSSVSSVNTDDMERMNSRSRSSKAGWSVDPVAKSASGSLRVSNDKKETASSSVNPSHDSDVKKKGSNTSSSSSHVSNDTKESKKSSNDSEVPKVMPIASDETKECFNPTVLFPFVYSKHRVRYNHAAGVPYTAPFLIGTRSRTPQPASTGYRPTHLFFDPRLGTLTSGTDVDFGWEQLGKNSLITGAGNVAQLGNSFVSGANNCIYDINKSGVLNNSIIGGHDNTISFSSSDLPQGNISIIGCDGVKVVAGSNSVFLGLSGMQPNVSAYILNNTTVTSTLYAFDSFTVGYIPTHKEILRALPVKNGSILSKSADRVDISDEIYIMNPTITNRNGDTLTNGVSYATTAAYGGDIYAVGPKPPQGQPYPGGNIFGKNVVVQTVATESIISAAVNVIDASIELGPSSLVANYNAAPIQQNVTLLLDASTESFIDGQTIHVKDITQVFQPNTSFNIIITVNNGSYIEHRDPIGQVIQTENGSYVVNTTGGAVTLRYIAAPIPGAHNTWVIDTEFIGRQRLLA